MKIIEVYFKTNPNKRYEYKTNLELIPGASYLIKADYVTEYGTPVVIVGYKAKQDYDRKLREITHAACYDAPKRKDSKISKVIFNEEKGVTVILWKDNTKTKVRCQEGDVFDKEKAIALCYMKKCLGNTGAFNEVLKKYTKE